MNTDFDQDFGNTKNTNFNRLAEEIEQEEGVSDPLDTQENANEDDLYLEEHNWLGSFRPLINPESGRKKVKNRRKEPKEGKNSPRIPKGFHEKENRKKKKKNKKSKKRRMRHEKGSDGGSNEQSVQENRFAGEVGVHSGENRDQHNLGEIYSNHPTEGRFDTDIY